MSRKMVCTRADPHSWENVAVDESLSGLFTGNVANALPAGRAHVGRRGETANRLHVIPAGPEASIFWTIFSVLQSLFLLQIAYSRACGNSEAVARDAHAPGRIAAILGAVRTSAVAYRLEGACRSGDHAATYGLLSDLSEACDQATTELAELLKRDSAGAGSNRP